MKVVDEGGRASAFPRSMSRLVDYARRPRRTSRRLRVASPLAFPVSARLRVVRTLRARTARTARAPFSSFRSRFFSRPLGRFLLLLPRLFPRLLLRLARLLLALVLGEDRQGLLDAVHLTRAAPGRARGARGPAAAARGPRRRRRRHAPSGPRPSKRAPRISQSASGRPRAGRARAAVRRFAVAEQAHLLHVPRVVAPVYDPEARTSPAPAPTRRSRAPASPSAPRSPAGRYRAPSGSRSAPEP